MYQIYNVKLCCKIMSFIMHSEIIPLSKAIRVNIVLQKQIVLVLLFLNVIETTLYTARRFPD